MLASTPRCSVARRDKKKGKVRLTTVARASNRNAKARASAPDKNNSLGQNFLVDILIDESEEPIDPVPQLAVRLRGQEPLDNQQRLAKLAIDGGPAGASQYRNKAGPGCRADQDFIL